MKLHITLGICAMLLTACFTQAQAGQCTTEQLNGTWNLATMRVFPEAPDTSVPGLNDTYDAGRLVISRGNINGDKSFIQTGGKSKYSLSGRIEVDSKCRIQYAYFLHYIPQDQFHDLVGELTGGVLLLPGHKGIMDIQGEHHPEFCMTQTLAHNRTVIINPDGEPEPTNINVCGGPPYTFDMRLMRQ